MCESKSFSLCRYFLWKNREVRISHTVEINSMIINWNIFLEMSLVRILINFLETAASLPVSLRNEQLIPQFFP